MYIRRFKFTGSTMWSARVNRLQLDGPFCSLLILRGLACIHRRLGALASLISGGSGSHADRHQNGLLCSVAGWLRHLRGAYYTLSAHSYWVYCSLCLTSKARLYWPRFPLALSCEHRRCLILASGGICRGISWTTYRDWHPLLPQLNILGR